MGMNARTRAAWGRARGWLALCVGVVALSACGGGGGGGSGWHASGIDLVQERPLSQTPVRSVELLPDRADMPSTMVALSDRVLGFSGVTQLRTTVMWVPKEAR